MSSYRNSNLKEDIVHKVEPRNREPLPEGPPELRTSIRYLREKCEPLRGMHGAVAAYHVLVVLDAMENKAPVVANPGLKKRKET
jgi:hypothetical protein